MANGDWKWEELGVRVPHMLLPKKQIDWQKWAVLACDQYTSQDEYWESVSAFVEDSPSTLNMILPEAWLGREKEQVYIDRARSAMRDYVEQDILQTLPPGSILVERSAKGNTRHGLMLSVDLEEYDYHVESQSLIRATEGTIESRIPSRRKMRSGAELEIPHIIILIDDPERTVIEPLLGQQFETCYDFELMKDGGHVSGRFIPQNALSKVRDALGMLKEKSRHRYGQAFLFAVGDGNHSLASAKAHWEAIKQTLCQDERENHPARFALAEIENIHDKGIVFEPIHRVLFDLSDPSNAKARMDALIAQNEGSHSLPVGVLENALERYREEVPGVSVDYIHGEETATALADASNDRLCYLLSPMDKGALFDSVAKDGPLPRKAFSMGEADEKRFYIECRRIK